jgi:hypothetical protein
MPLRILDIGKQFRPKTSIVYPPFKNGRYMEEYFYDYVTNSENNNTIEAGLDRVYIPAFWTNIQNHPNFSNMKDSLNVLLKRATELFPETTNYFTVVQADLGVELTLPKNTLVFGACYGDIPLPLIYEDITNRLLNTQQQQQHQHQRKYRGSFVGTYTHPLRQTMFLSVGRNPNFKFETTDTWTNSVSSTAADTFIRTTLNSKFCLAPRGFGRSSFRFFEAIQLDTIPVYFWDDIEWLPYKDILDYTKFSVSIHESEIDKTAEILRSISNEKYVSMVEELKRVRHYFTLDSMCKYIISKLTQ